MVSDFECIGQEWTYDKDVHQCTETLVHEEGLFEIVWSPHLRQVSKVFQASLDWTHL
jgi:hypothetical protein